MEWAVQWLLDNKKVVPVWGGDSSDASPGIRAAAADVGFGDGFGGARECLSTPPPMYAQVGDATPVTLADQGWFVDALTAMVDEAALDSHFQSQIRTQAGVDAPAPLLKALRAAHAAFQLWFTAADEDTARGVIRCFETAVSAHLSSVVELCRTNVPTHNLVSTATSSVVSLGPSKKRRRSIGVDTSPGGLTPVSSVLTHVDESHGWAPGSSDCVDDHGSDAGGNEDEGEDSDDGNASCSEDDYPDAHRSRSLKRRRSDGSVFSVPPPSPFEVHVRSVEAAVDHVRSVHERMLRLAGATRAVGVMRTHCENATAAMTDAHQKAAAALEAST